MLSGSRNTQYTIHNAHATAYKDSGKGVKHRGRKEQLIFLIGHLFGKGRGAATQRVKLSFLDCFLTDEGSVMVYLERKTEV